MLTEFTETDFWNYYTITNHIDKPRSTFKETFGRLRPERAGLMRRLLDADYELRQVKIIKLVHYEYIMLLTIETDPYHVTIRHHTSRCKRNRYNKGTIIIILIIIIIIIQFNYLLLVCCINSQKANYRCSTREYKIINITK
jgi:hypothetical protein